MELNTLEREFLSVIDWRLMVSYFSFISLFLFHKSDLRAL